MAKRKKSVNQLYSQYRRILDENIRQDPTLTNPRQLNRADRALAAYTRYIKNVGRNSAVMQKKWDVNRPISQRTYMGLSNG